MEDSPHEWKVGMLIYNPSGIFNEKYYERLGIQVPPRDTSGVVVLVETVESLVPSYLFTIVTPSNKYSRVSYEALSVVSVS